MCNDPNLDLVTINAYTKFGEILSIWSEDIEWNEIMMDWMTHGMTDDPNPI